MRQYVLQRVLQGSFYELPDPQACKDLLNETKVANDPVPDFWREFAGEFA